MTEKIVRPRGLRTTLLDSHPVGCARTVEEMVAEVPEPHAAPGSGPVALVIGASSGYGIAMAVAGLFAHGIKGVGLALEKPASERRSASSGWYRARALAEAARAAGADFELVNGDCFTNETKEQVLDLLAERFGRVDYLVYSVAAPRRTDPDTGETYHSAIKPLGAVHTTRTLDFDAAGGAGIREVTLSPASDEELSSTIKVMGGEDWAAWVQALQSRGLIGPRFRTVALSYVGSDITAAVYRQGTIGRAKDHLEETAKKLTGLLEGGGGAALTSVNGAVVTLASTVIPGISLYVSLLRGVLGKGMETAVHQSVRLWDQLTGTSPLELDDQGRIRLDGWEMDPEVQDEMRRRWAEAGGGALGEAADVGWFQTEILRLYGFGVQGVDYDRPVELDLPWPSRQPS